MEQNKKYSRRWCRQTIESVLLEYESYIMQFIQFHDSTTFGRYSPEDLDWRVLLVRLRKYQKKYSLKTQGHIAAIDNTVNGYIKLLRCFNDFLSASCKLWDELEDNTSGKAYNLFHKLFNGDHWYGCIDDWRFQIGEYLIADEQ